MGTLSVLPSSAPMTSAAGPVITAALPRGLVFLEIPSAGVAAVEPDALPPGLSSAAIDELCAIALNVREALTAWAARHDPTPGGPAVTINTDLLRRTLEQIENHPETWCQADYRCGSGMCFAGWTCQLAGGTWAADSEAPLGECLIAEPDEEETFTHDDLLLISAHTRARRLLGLDEQQADELFYGRNTPADLRRMVTELCGEES
ncbi:hypothetical protein [Streptosporangium saharense]|uniref:hypothetical protein n=1 Tax=Streptosporangium saharense TaxID=1706840 RepID=UPI003414CF55